MKITAFHFSVLQAGICVVLCFAVSPTTSTNIVAPFRCIGQTIVIKFIAPNELIIIRRYYRIGRLWRRFSGTCRWWLLPPAPKGYGQT